MIDVKATLKESEERMEMAAMYLEDQLSHVRAGRANVAILDGVRVNSYGSMVPLNQVANVSTPDPRTIAIRPWDKKMIKDIEKAIMDSDVGITPENNGEIVRLGIPQPTEERRKDLAKQYQEDLIIYKINVDKEQELAAVFGVRSIPTILFVPQKGKPMLSQGALPKEEFVKQINEFLLKK